MQVDSNTGAIPGYSVGPEIGRGSFATVYKATQLATSKLVAIKSVARAKLNRKLAENLESEIKILKRIHHPHIVELYDIFVNKYT